MKKVFWFINQYSSTPEVGLGGRHYYLAEELAEEGHKVYVIASSYNHLRRESTKQDQEFKIEKINKNLNFVWVKVPRYDGAHSKVRILNWFLFSAKLRKLVSLGLDQPDVILYSSPSIFGYFGSKYLADFYKKPLVFEVRDIWPLSLIELGSYSPKHPFIRLMQWIEDKAYKESDFVFSNLFNAVEHMQSRGMPKGKFHWIPNGFSLKEVSKKEPLDTSVLSIIPKNKFLIGYTGTIGVANAINDLIEAAKLLKPYRDIHFLLVGNGKEKKDLIQLTREYELENVTFIDAIPKRQVQSIIEHFDICFIGSQNKSIYRFGVAPNKIPEYLYSGKPIIHAFSGAGCLIKQSNAGLSIESGDPVKIAQAVLKLYDCSDKERHEMGDRGKRFALEFLDYKVLSKKLTSILFGE